MNAKTLKKAQALFGPALRPEDFGANTLPSIQEPQGPTDDELFAAEGLDFESAREWLDANLDRVPGLVEPKTEADLRANARAVRAAMAVDASSLKKTNSERLLGDLTRRAFMPREDAEEVNPGDAYDALLQLTPSVAERFAETWRRAEPWEDVEGQIAERRHARERAEHYRARSEANEEMLEEVEEIASAVGDVLDRNPDAARLGHLLEEFTPDLAESEDADDARERMEFGVSAACETDRAARESTFKKDLVSGFATEMDSGWAEDDGWTVERASREMFAVDQGNLGPRIRPENLGRLETDDEIRASIADNSLGDSFEDFVAEAPAKEEAAEDLFADRTVGDAA